MNCPSIYAWNFKFNCMIKFNYNKQKIEAERENKTKQVESNKFWFGTS